MGNGVFAALGKNLFDLGVRAGNDELADATRRGGPGVCRSFHRADVAANHRAHVASADVFFADQHDVAYAELMSAYRGNTRRFVKSSPAAPQRRRWASHLFARVVGEISIEIWNSVAIDGRVRARTQHAGCSGCACWVQGEGATADALLERPAALAGRGSAGLIGGPVLLDN